MPSQLRHWKQQKTKLEELLASRAGSRVNKDKKSIHVGSNSCLSDIENELLNFIFQTREQGVAVSIRMVVTRACELDNTFWHKTNQAKEQAV